MRIYIIRHGQTDWNKTLRLQGQSNIDLNQEGRELALETAEALKEVPFDVAITSPLNRAVETATILTKYRNIPIYKDDRIKEISFGEFEGLSCDRNHYTIPDPNFINFFDHPEAYVPPKDGESIESLCKRTTEFLMELVNREDLQDKTILVSTHGAALRGILSSLTCNDPSDFWKGGVHKNCAVTILEVENGTIKIVEEGKTYYKSQQNAPKYQ